MARSQQDRRDQRIRRKIKRISKEIDEIDKFFYHVEDDDLAQVYGMLERKRDDMVRSTVLQLHTAIEDLLDVWLKSEMLDVPPQVRNAVAQRRRARRRTIDDLLKGGRALGFDAKLRLLVSLGLIRRPLQRKLETLNQLRNKCSHNWLLKDYVRRGIKPHLPKRPLLQYQGRDLHKIAVLQDFAGEYGRTYFRLFGRVYLGPGAR
jgi:hypothetical protein